jgi:hypothetical protein
MKIKEVSEDITSWGNSISSLKTSSDEENTKRDREKTEEENKLKTSATHSCVLPRSPDVQIYIRKHYHPNVRSPT